MDNNYNILLSIADTLDLSNLSEEEIDRLFDTPLFQQVRSRNEFINSVEALGWQIAENLCLILFFQRYSKDPETLNRVKAELYSECLLILRKRIAYNCKQNLLTHIFFYIMDFDDKEYVYECLWDKFNKEGISIQRETEALHTVVEQFQRILRQDLIPLLCDTKNPQKLRAYINDL